MSKPPSLYQLHGYNTQYNYNKINQAYGSALFIKKLLKMEAKVEMVDSLRISSTAVEDNFKNFVKINTTYRCHNIQKWILLSN